MQTYVFKAKNTGLCTFRWMRGGGNWAIAGQRLRVVLPLAIGLALGLAVVAKPATAAPYEPNESAPAAAGPLLFGQTYWATLESGGDRDFFYFYVASPQATQVELAVRNLGGGGEPSDLDASILDLSGTAVAGQAFIRDAETRVVSATLEAGKYYVEVAPGEGFGDSYSLSAGGATGGFASYTQIAGRCELAQKTIGKDSVRVQRAKARLQRSVARLRRTRYAKRAAREKAQAAHRKALAAVKERRLDLVEARRSRRPWCSIGA
jgi:hypothetical protein